MQTIRIATRPSSTTHGLLAIILLCEAPASSEEVVEEDNLLDSAREAVQQENLCKLCANCYEPGKPGLSMF